MINKNEIELGDIVRIIKYDETVDVLFDYSNLIGCIFEVANIDVKNSDCPYGLKNQKDEITYFRKDELELICKNLDRIDLH